MKAQTRQARSDLDQAVQDTQAELWKDYEAVRLAKAKVIALEELRTNAATSFDVAQGRYKSGVGSMLELLKAQGDLADMDLQVLQAAADVQSATVALAVALGAFDVRR